MVSKQKVIDYILAAYFMVLSFMMHYFIEEQLTIGSLALTYRHIFALLIIFSGFIVFLFRPNVSGAVVSIKGALVLSVPLLIEITVSLLIWYLDKSDPAVIRRGISQMLVYNNWFSFAMAAGVLLMLFGEKGIWLNLAAILASNCIMVLRIMLQNGVGIFLSQYITLLLSFADTTGDVIMQAEIHELAFCEGAYLLYMICKPQKKLWFWVLFLLCGFFFSMALKRIAVLGIVFALFFYLLFMIVQKKTPLNTCKFVNFIMFLTGVLLIVYVYLIHADIFTILQQNGVETTGRSVIYSAVNKYYDFSPSFIGNGVGFIIYQLNTNEYLRSITGVGALHNDFLAMYIDMGFWGYILWLISMTISRSRYFGRNNRVDASVICAVLTFYLIICCSTDNTLEYPLLTSVLCLLMMGNHYDEDVAEQKLRLKKFHLYDGR